MRVWPIEGVVSPEPTQDGLDTVPGFRPVEVAQNDGGPSVMELDEDGQSEKDSLRRRVETLERENEVLRAQLALSHPNPGPRRALVAGPSGAGCKSADASLRDDAKGGFDPMQVLSVGIAGEPRR
jgi:hypothetical protein